MNRQFFTIMTRQQLKDTVFLNVAKQIGTLSRCKRLKVGAVLVRDNRIISIGYNGTPTGLDNECECNDTTKESVVHAEMNAIMFAAKNGIGTDKCTLYVTDAPCYGCTRSIIQAGIVRVVYSREYHSDGLPLLNLVKIPYTLWEKE